MKDSRVARRRLQIEGGGGHICYEIPQNMHISRMLFSRGGGMRSCRMRTGWLGRVCATVVAALPVATMRSAKCECGVRRASAKLLAQSSVNAAWPVLGLSYLLNDGRM